MQHFYGNSNYNPSQFEGSFKEKKQVEKLSAQPCAVKPKSDDKAENLHQFEYKHEGFWKTTPRKKHLRQQSMDYNPNHLGQGFTGSRNSTANVTQQSIPMETPPENTKTNINIGIGTMNFNMNIGGTQTNLRYQAGSITNTKRFQPVKIFTNPVPQKGLFPVQRPGADSLISNSLRKRPASMCAQDFPKDIGALTSSPSKSLATILRRKSTGQFFNPSPSKHTPFASTLKTARGKKDLGPLQELENRLLWNFNNVVKNKKLASLQSYYSPKPQKIPNPPKPSLTWVKP